MQAPFITKADGTSEPFDPRKLSFSLKRAGAHDAVIERILEQVQEELEDGTTTRAIYQKAFSLLKKAEKGVAARYSLKRAMFDLGPSGYPFEEIIGEVFRREGYEANVASMIQGTCALHEVDLDAHKDGRRIGGEIKFHNRPGLKSDLKIALYVHARYEDLQQTCKENPFTKWYLITNTKFTEQALSYGACKGLQLISWSYPPQGNLQDKIEASNVHPLTCLTQLSVRHKRILLNQRIVLCTDLTNNPSLLDQLGLSDVKKQHVLDEVMHLCRST